MFNCPSRQEQIESCNPGSVRSRALQEARLVLSEEECPCCSLCLEDIETAWHLWQDCPALELERREISGGDADLSIKLVSFFSNN